MRTFRTLPVSGFPHAAVTHVALTQCTPCTGFTHNTLHITQKRKSNFQLHHEAEAAPLTRWPSQAAQACTKTQCLGRRQSDHAALRLLCRDKAVMGGCGSGSRGRGRGCGWGHGGCCRSGIRNKCLPLLLLFRAIMFPTNATSHPQVSTCPLASRLHASIPSVL